MGSAATLAAKARAAKAATDLTSIVAVGEEDGGQLNYAREFI
jgi:hypothetical protein